MRIQAFKDSVIVVSICVVVGAIAFFVGSGIAEHRADAKLLVAREEIGALKSRDALRMANISAYRAAFALDNRNFGLANDASKATQTNLQNVDASKLGIDAAQILALREKLAAVHISVASDVASPRAQVAGIAKDLTTLNQQAQIEPSQR